MGLASCPPEADPPWAETTGPDSPPGRGSFIYFAAVAAALRMRFNFFLSRFTLSSFLCAFSLLRPFFLMPILMK